MVDARNGSRIRYHRVNEETGEEVPWSQITKSYEYEKGSYVILDEDKLEDFEPELTKTVDLETFVDVNSISPLMYEKPYYLVPKKRSHKPYVLLRESLKQTGKCGLGRVVIRTKQHLAIIMPVEDALVLNLLLFPQELKSLKDFEFPAAEDYTDKIKAREVALSTELIASMSDTFQPKDFHDTYSERLIDWIDEQVKSGSKSKKKSKSKSASKKKSSNVINIESLLQKSLKGKKSS